MNRPNEVEVLRASFYANKNPAIALSLYDLPFWVRGHSENVTYAKGLQLQPLGPRFNVATLVK